VFTFPVKVLTDDLVATQKPEPETEVDWVRRCQKGDRSCFRKLYQHYSPRVRSTLYQLCGSEALDDLVQEVFLRTWKGLPKLRQATQFSTWLYRISWNVATDRRRQFAQEYSHRERLTQALTVRPNAPDLMHLHYQEVVQQGLQQLSFEHRVVLVLHDLEDIPQKEIAQILSIPLGTVKSRLFHGRASLRQFLEQQGELL
jgi:RNA polymerase sigma-70 factor (ECF subfamily)